METEGSKPSPGSLVQWLNSVFNIPVPSIEALGSGFAFCFIFNSIFPNTLPIHRIKTAPRFRHEFLLNFKLLNYGFDKAGLSYDFPLESLVNLDSEANFQLLSFLKQQFEEKKPEPPGPKEKEKFSELVRKNSKEISELAFLRIHPGATRSQCGSFSPEKLSGGMEVEKAGEPGAGKPQKEVERTLLGYSVGEIESFKKVRNERDFYYGKLRDIDHYLDVFDRDVGVETLAKYIRDIVYSMPEQEVRIEEDGEVIIRRKEGPSEESLSKEQSSE